MSARTGVSSAHLLLVLQLGISTSTGPNYANMGGIESPEVGLLMGRCYGIATLRTGVCPIVRSLPPSTPPSRWYLGQNAPGIGA